MNDWLRYSCQIALPGFEKATQEKLAEAKVLVVGAGGLGCPALQYLSAIGVGCIGIADGDTVSINNLHRQILYTPNDEGKKKATVAKERLSQQNPDIDIETHDLFVSHDNVMDVVSRYDMVLDCTDNFDTRYLLNDACVLTGKPLVYGAIYQYEGQIAVWNVANNDGTYSPNYRDLFPEVNAAAIPNCADGGVMPTIAGVIGCMQANEAVKYITGTEGLLVGKLLVFDARSMQSRVMKLGTQTKTNITQLPQKTVVNEIEYNAIQSSTDYELVDVRSEEERHEFNIGGLHIPLHELKADLFISVIKPIVFYCASGKRSTVAVQQLQKELPNNKLYSLKGGLNSLRQEH